MRVPPLKRVLPLTFMFALASCVVQADTAETGEPENLGEASDAVVCSCDAIVANVAAVTGPQVQGQLAQQTGGLRGLYLDEGTQWIHVAGEVANVKQFGAKGDGVTPDHQAIQAAVDSLVDGGVVFFPRGRYVLQETISIEVSNVAMVGGPGATLVMVFPAEIAVLVDTPVSRVSIEGLTFNAEHGPSGEVSTSVIQLNQCTDCAVRHVGVFWTGGMNLPTQLDGITMAAGSSGVIQGAVIEGIPKAGILVTGGIGGAAHDVVIDSCNVRNIHGEVGGAGISIAGDEVTVSNCSVQGSRDGVLISPIGGRGDVNPERIQIVGGQFYNNTRYGLHVEGNSRNTPMHIRIIGASAYQNVATGFLIGPSTDVMLSAVTARSNGNHGILLDGLTFAGQPPLQLPLPTRVRRVEVSDALVYDNRIAGIGLRAADGVLINGGRLYRTLPLQPIQNSAVRFFSGAMDPSTGVRILDIDVSISSPIDADPGAAAVSGFYRLQRPGPPQTLEAPIGSQWTDLMTGDVYRRVQGPPPQWVTP